MLAAQHGCSVSRLVLSHITKVLSLTVPRVQAAFPAVGQNPMSRTARKDENASRNSCLAMPHTDCPGQGRPQHGLERRSKLGRFPRLASLTTEPSSRPRRLPVFPPKTRDNLVGLPGPGKRTFPPCNVKKGPHVLEPTTPAGVLLPVHSRPGALCQFPQNFKHDDWLSVFCPRHVQDAGLFLLPRLCSYPPLLLLLLLLLLPLCPVVLCSAVPCSFLPSSFLFV